MKKTLEEQMDEAYAAIHKWETEVAERNNSLIESLGIPGEDLQELLCDCSRITDFIDVVSEPGGDNQDNIIGIFSEVYVDQSSVGDSGDSFAGYIYGKLGENKWLRVPYEC